jgi:cytoplasmic tRNA 2-thiolation protein 1
MMNLLRGDVSRLQRCVAVMTEGESDSAIPRCKPFKYTYEKEIVMYAYFKKLDYFSTECVYSPNAYRGYARDLIKDMERIRPSTILDIIHSGERFGFDIKPEARQVLGKCERCGYVSSQRICRACELIHGLNTGDTLVALHKSGSTKKDGRPTTTLDASSQSAADTVAPVNASSSSVDVVSSS